MRTLRFLLKKEFKQIFRNRSLLPLILVMPIIQLIIIPLAADYEVKNINIAVVDHDHSDFSRDLTNKIVGSGYFRLDAYGSSFNKAFRQIEKDKADLILEIPAGFEKNMVREQEQDLFVAINAINGVKANLGGSYLASILQDYNVELRAHLMGGGHMQLPSSIDVTFSNWYNPHLNYNFFMVPGILVILVTMVGSYLCALNIVKEKEIGTIEQINVTPIRKYQFILGKLIPFWIIGMFDFTLGLFGVGWLIYGIFPVGSIGLLYLYLSLYLIAILGLGLLISTYSQTQQQAMSLAFFFMMIFLLMSGLFTSIDSMPAWSKVIAYCNPVTYFIDVVRMIVLRGSGFGNIIYHIVITASFALLLNIWAVFNYKKTS